MYRRMKKLTWLADSRSRVKLFPAGVQDDIAYALYVVQLGERSVKAKALHVHAFQKKSKVGIATPKPEMDLIRQRLKQLRGEVKSAEKRGS
jgi:phage-related protein